MQLDSVFRNNCEHLLLGKDLGERQDAYFDVTQNLVLLILLYFLKVIANNYWRWAKNYPHLGLLSFIGHVSHPDLLRRDVFFQFVEHRLVDLSRYLRDNQFQIVKGINIVAEVEFQMLRYLEDARCSLSVFLLEQ